MTVPARRNQKQQIYALQRRQLIILLVLVIMALIGELLLSGGVIITKSIALGAILHYIAQSIFTVVAYRETGVKVRQKIMLNMYLGQMLKWLITLMGFALIFLYAKPVMAPLAIVGYFVTQLACSVSMWRLK